jgi:uncharacterized protein (TIGR02145 family)
MRTINILVIAILLACNAIVKAQDTLYIYKSGTVVAKHAVAQIDSVIFYKAQTTAPQEGTVVDIEGNVYHTVTIGMQVWMQENLKVTKYSNGDVIGTTPYDTSNISGQSTPYQWAYGGNESNVPMYGRLYTWYVTADSRNVCPSGWHVPTKVEWTTLITYLGNESGSGGKLKEAGTTHWNNPNSGADNSSGFTALPGGFRDIKQFSSLLASAYWWTSTQYNTYSGWYWAVDYNTADAASEYVIKQEGYSIRCLKN